MKIYQYHKDFAYYLVLALFLTGCSLEGEISSPERGDGFMTTFYVAPDGDDAAAGTEEFPFATLERARDAVREIEGELSGDIFIAVAPGDYVMAQPLVLTPEDSGRNGYTIRYRGLGDPGTARLLGGEPITGWEPVEGGIFRARVGTGAPFHALFENGIRARKARFPNREFDPRFPLSDAAYLTAESGTSSTLVWKKGDLAAIEGVDLGDEANLIVWPWGYCDWHKTPRKILSIDRASRTIEIEDIGVAIGQEARFYVEGALGLLDAPGEFHYDAGQGFLYYWPRFGQPSEHTIIRPGLKRILSLEGESGDNPVRDVVIEGLGLAFTDAFAHMEGTTMFPWSETSAAPHGILHLRHTENVEILFNHIQGSGMNGIYLERSNKRNRIYGNWIEDSGISGIVFAYHRQARQNPNDFNEDNLVENNLIHGMGSVAVDSAGINIWGGTGNVVRHCEIFDGARYGISMRGPYTQLRGDDPTGDMSHTNRPILKSNRIEYSHLYRLAQDSGDTAALHMAGVSSKKDHPVNFLEQLLFEDIIAHPSMKDMPPEGIYFDYSEGVTDQVLRNVEVRGTPNPFRTNRTDIRHTYENVSWRDGFDPVGMEYDRIGLLDDFPENFRRPSELSGVNVREELAGESRRLGLSWKAPSGDAPVSVVITAEGVPGISPVRVPQGRHSVEIERPDEGRLVMLRIQTERDDGTRSQGILVPAAQRPEPATGIDVTGIADGVELQWQRPEGEVMGHRVVVVGAGLDPIETPAGVSTAWIPNLEENRTYSIRVDTIDSDGHSWRGETVRATAGERFPIPQDMAAWWTFDEDEIFEGKSIGDRSGQGNTLFVGDASVKLTEGLDGKALWLDGNTGYVRALDATQLAIGTGDYALSLWIKRPPFTAMSGRIIHFGGGTRGVWEHWGEEPPANGSQAGLNLMLNDYSLGALLHDGTRSYDARTAGLQLTNAWNHLIVNVERSNAMTVWLNGSQVASTRIAASAGRDIRPGANLYLGRDPHVNHPNLYWRGAIDQLRVYKRALSPAEIAALYAEGEGLAE